MPPFTPPFFPLSTCRDWQLAASSVVSRASDPDCAVKHARLHAPGKQAWCPEQGRENEWILVDLGVTSEVAGVMTQGRDKKGAQSWVTHYFISYSEDAYRWDWARDIYGIKKVQNSFLFLIYCFKSYTGLSLRPDIRTVS